MPDDRTKKRNAVFSARTLATLSRNYFTDLDARHAVPQITFFWIYRFTVIDLNWFECTDSFLQVLHLLLLYRIAQISWRG